MMMETPPTMARGISRAGSFISPAMVPTLVHPSNAKSTASSTEPNTPPALLPSPTSGEMMSCPPSPQRKPKMMSTTSGMSLQMVATTCMPPASFDPSALIATSEAITMSAMGSLNCAPRYSESSLPTFTPYPARKAG